MTAKWYSGTTVVLNRPDICLTGEEKRRKNFAQARGRLARRIKRRGCDVGEAKEGLENKLWRRWSNGMVGGWAVTYVKRRKAWRMSCDVGEVTERLENEQSSKSQLILQPFRRFTYITADSPTLLLLHLRHSSFSNPSVASPTSQLILQPFFHFSYITGSSLASRPCIASIKRIKKLDKTTWLKSATCSWSHLTSFSCLFVFFLSNKLTLCKYQMLI